MVEDIGASSYMCFQRECMILTCNHCGLKYTCNLLVKTSHNKSLFLVCIVSNCDVYDCGGCNKILQDKAKICLQLATGPTPAGQPQAAVSISPLLSIVIFTLYRISFFISGRHLHLIILIISVLLFTSGHRTISGQKLSLCNLCCACSVKVS